MSAQWDKLNQSQVPDTETMGCYVGSPLWNTLCHHLEADLGALSKCEYSRCSMPGWNLKYRKAGRGLCTLYPERGSFTALLVIGERERTETELLLPGLTGYVRRLYDGSEAGNTGQKWLMIQVTDEAILADVVALIAVRRGMGKK